MHRILKIGSLAFMLGLLCENPSYAILINVDLASPGDNLLVKDTGTALEWLTMPPTRLALETSEGVPPDQILAGYGGFIADGFEFASSAQIEQLFLDAGITDLTGALGTADVAGTKLLLSLFGNVDPDPYVRVVQGFADVNVVAGTADVPAVVLIPAGTQYNETPNDVAEAIVCLSAGSCQSFGLNTGIGTGDWLVRAAPSGVPEPSTWAMLVAGFTGLGWLGLRRRERGGLRTV